MSKHTLKSSNGGKIQLAPIKVGDSGTVENTSTEAGTFELAPALGEKINGGAVDASVTIANGVTKTISCTVDGDTTLT